MEILRLSVGLTQTHAAYDEIMSVVFLTYFQGLQAIMENTALTLLFIFPNPSFEHCNTIYCHKLFL